MTRGTSFKAALTTSPRDPAVLSTIAPELRTRRRLDSREGVCTNESRSSKIILGWTDLMGRHLALGWPRISGLTLGLIVCVMAVAATPLGLGAESDFIFWKLWGVPRKTTCYAGVILMLVSIASHPALVTTAFPAAALRAEFTAQAREKRWSQLPLVLFGQLAIATIVAAVAFFVNRNNLLGYIDGQYLLTIGRNQAEFMGREF